MGFSLRTHEAAMKQGRKIIKKINPYLRLTKGDGPPVFLQGGRFYYESGEEVTDPPDWLDGELKKLNPEALKQVGMEELIPKHEVSKPVSRRSTRSTAKP